MTMSCFNSSATWIASSFTWNILAFFFHVSLSVKFSLALGVSPCFPHSAFLNSRKFLIVEMDVNFQSWLSLSRLSLNIWFESGSIYSWAANEDIMFKGVRWPYWKSQPQNCLRIVMLKKTNKQTKKSFSFQHSCNSVELIQITLLSQYNIWVSNIAWKNINNTEIRGVIECN